jgi:hypothetical protein
MGGFGKPKTFKLKKTYATSTYGISRCKCLFLQLKTFLDFVTGENIW